MSEVSGCAAPQAEECAKGIAPDEVLLIESSSNSRLKDVAIHM